MPVVCEERIACKSLGLGAMNNKDVKIRPPKQLAQSLRDEGKTWVEIGKVLQRSHNINARVALRLAHAWSQETVANHWNDLFPDNPKRGKDVSCWERWPASTGHEPSLEVLKRLALIYECSVSDLVS